MSDIRVKLTLSQVMQAAIVGVMRQTQNMKNGAEHKHGARDETSWQTNIEGAIGELAVASHFGIFWDGSLGVYSAPDVGEYEVRATSWNDGCLLLHKSDADDRWFYLVTGVPPWVTIRGKLRGRDGKRDAYWADPTRRDRWAYFVPQEALEEA